MAIATGSIDEIIRNIRRWINDRNVNPTYSNSELLRLASRSHDRVIEDVFTVPDDKPFMQFDLPLYEGQKEYVLPTGMGHIYQIAVLGQPPTGGSVTERLVDAIVPAYRQDDVRWPGWTWTPPFLRFPFPPSKDVTIRITFVPRAIEYIHQGIINSTDITQEEGELPKIKLALNPSIGDFDPRPNAFIAGRLRLLDSNTLPSGHGHFPWQERDILEYNPTDRFATLSSPFDFTVAGSAVKYEIVPMSETSLLYASAIDTARHIHAMMGNNERYVVTTREYEVALTTARRVLGSRNKAFPIMPTPRRYLRRGGSFSDQVVRDVTQGVGDRFLVS